MDVVVLAILVPVAGINLTFLTAIYHTLGKLEEHQRNANGYLAQINTRQDRAERRLEETSSVVNEIRARCPLSIKD